MVAYLNTGFSRTVKVQRAHKLSILISGNHYISVKPHVRIGQEVFLKSSPEAVSSRSLVSGRATSDHAQGLRVSDGLAEELSLAQMGLIKEASLGKSIYFKGFQAITFGC